MVEFTPGPWEAKEWVCHAVTTVMSGDIVIAECSGHGRPSADSIADASLIATALEMYGTLQAALIEFEACHEVMLLNPANRGMKEAAIIPQIRTVLAKAEGKSNG